MKTSRRFLPQPVFILSCLTMMLFVSACGSSTAGAASPDPTVKKEATLSPQATSTQACTFSQVCAPGDDWSHECISSRWVIYPTNNVPIYDNGCYQQPIWKNFFTRDGSLEILAQHTYLTTAEEYGVFTQIPQSSTVNLNVELDLVDNGEVWVGVFAKTDINSEGVLLVAPPGDVKSHAFAVKSMPNIQTIELTPIYSNPNGKYSIGFNVDNGAVTPVVENAAQKPVGFSSSQRWLFIGYRAKLVVENGNANITAMFSDLQITPK